MFYMRGASLEGVHVRKDQRRQCAREGENNSGRRGEKQAQRPRIGNMACPRGCREASAAGAVGMGLGGGGHVLVTGRGGQQFSRGLGATGLCP